MSGIREMYLTGASMAMNGIDPAELSEEYNLMIDAIEEIGYEPTSEENKWMVLAEGYLLEFGYL